MDKEELEIWLNTYLEAMNAEYYYHAEMCRWEIVFSYPPTRFKSAYYIRDNELLDRELLFTRLDKLRSRYKDWLAAAIRLQKENVELPKEEV